ncbi:hypothetical protein JQC92_13370 [Shewanella sp. 202IG2-18]|uniref:hypothetical protein n=1 Tax=Parashewanella hymeniacidonis TaxID=2807618 RepID=UPI00195F2CF0|nr:hypothetical protein [Parashewanella hymeniacidonis]MBM7073006.1 hypothetical protein [Parashewanella hymeniacidonis]
MAVLQDPQKKDLRAELIKNGWMQGVIIDFSDIPGESISASIINGTIKDKHQAKLLVITQDCDILSVESFVECLLLKKVSREAPTQKNGHNPRKIQLEPINSAYWEIRADDVVYVEKELLRTTYPLNSFKVSLEQLAVIKQWKANRYTRTGLPERFVEKTGYIFKKPRGEVQKDESLENSELFKRFSKYIASIRVFCEEEGEITKCGFILLFKSILCKTDRVDIDEIEGLFDLCLLEKFRNLDGFELINDDDSEAALFEIHDLKDIMSDMQFPVGLQQVFPRYYFDYVSFGDDDVSDVESD